jgi:alpha-tubulin suppressor-like RCC1 family protein
MRGSTLFVMSVSGFLLTLLFCTEPAPALTGDLNGDGRVDYADMVSFSADWLASPPPMWGRGDNAALQQGLPPLYSCDTMAAIGADFGVLYVYVAHLNASGWLTWGNRPTDLPLSPESRPKAMAAGSSHLLVLNGDGTLQFYGTWQGSNPSLVPDGNDFLAIASGLENCLALTSGGLVIQWLPGMSNSFSFCEGEGYRAIAAGGYNAAALAGDGSIVAWGNQPDIYDVPAGTGYRAIAVGEMHGVAIASNGSLVAWGNNTWGQCDVPPGNDFTGVWATEFRSAAQRADGSLVAWGTYTGMGMPSAAEVPAGNDFTSVSLCGDLSIATRHDQSVVVWGCSRADSRNLERGKIRQIAAGAYHTVVLRSDGSLTAWGDNYYGQSTPPAGKDYIDVAAGGRHSLALKADGSLVAWGDSSEGHCNVPPGNDFIAIAAGDGFSIAERSDGTFAAWPLAYAWDFEFADGAAIASFTTGADHCVYLMKDGSLSARGDNSYGQCDVPDGNDFVYVSAGPGISMAIDSGGSAYVWGTGYWGSVPFVLQPGGYVDWWGCYHEPSPYVAVVGGENFLMLLTAEGMYRTTDDGAYGAISPNVAFSTIVAGRRHVLLLERDVPKPGDLNDDGTVDMTDFAIMAANWRR